MEAMDCALSSVCFRASGVLMSGLEAPERTATPRPTRAMSVVAPDAHRACAAASLNTSRGTTARSNGPPVVTSLISSGVVPKRKTSLWPDAVSNCALSSLNGPIMAPPAKTWSSAACTLAIDDRTNARPSTEAAAATKSSAVLPQQLR